MLYMFILKGAGFIRHYEDTVNALCEKGHLVHVAFEDNSKNFRLPGVLEVYESLTFNNKGFSYGPIGNAKAKDAWPLVSKARACLDYMRYFHPAYKNATALRTRVSRYVPFPFLNLMRVPFFQRGPIASTIKFFLRIVDNAAPVNAACTRVILEVAPDVVFVVGITDFNSRLVEYVRAAQYLKLKTGVLVASWDNLTNKGLIKVRPDLVTVWNFEQEKELLDFHSVPKDIIAVTGAQTFDKWFDRKVSKSRESFLENLGLDPTKKMILYLGSSFSISGDEAVFVESWLKTIRQSPDPSLRDANVIIRPHPLNVREFRTMDMKPYGSVKLHPEGGELPLGEENENSFFDVLSHSDAVVGINTSALIEAAIVGKKIFTVINDEDADHKSGTEETLHFQYLANPDYGIVTVSPSMDDHIAKLASQLNVEDDGKNPNEKFIKVFLRPFGSAEKSNDRLVASIEGIKKHSYPVSGMAMILYTPFRVLFYFGILLIFPIQIISNVVGTVIIKSVRFSRYLFRVPFGRYRKRLRMRKAHKK